MFGWTYRSVFPGIPFFLPKGMRFCRTGELAPVRFAEPLLCLVLCFCLATGVRLLELPFWSDSLFRLGDEFLLATHDAYHWIAGAEGFEFGAGHPMSELVRLIARCFGLSPALAGFWMPPFFGGLLAVAVFFWGWGLGQPHAGLCAGVIASLAPGFLARSMLGFCDTDLVILPFSLLLGLVPGLWLSPWLASLPEVLLPGFAQRGRTPFPNDGSAAPDSLKAVPFSGSDVPRELMVLAAQAPCCPPFFGKEAKEPGLFSYSPEEMEASALSLPAVCLLILAGLFGWQMQQWHSLFPYLARYAAVLPLCVIPVLGPVGGRCMLLRGSLCHALPLLMGIAGTFAALLLAVMLRLTRPSGQPDTLPWEEPEKGRNNCRKGKRRLPVLVKPRLTMGAIVRDPSVLILLWGLVLYNAFDAAVLQSMLDAFVSYTDKSAQMAITTASAADPLIFPKAGASVVEVQTISLHDLLLSMYPVPLATMLGFAALTLRLVFSPAFLWLLPLPVLALLSPHIGIRMAMFGPPALMLALCLEGGGFLHRGFHSLQMHWLQWRRFCPDSGPKPYGELRCLARRLLRSGPLLRFGVCLGLTVVLLQPLVRGIPEQFKGPALGREHGRGLSYLRENSPESSIIWDWWDWGYAAHHFARRRTIADGARRDGAGLYLSAAVYTTADARLARQIVKYTAFKDNAPKNVFADLSPSEVEQLMRDLADHRKPLVRAQGRQYLVVSTDLLLIGRWVTLFGSWNFATGQGQAKLMEKLYAELTFLPKTGLVTNGQASTHAASITVLGPDELELLTYDREQGFHFFFIIPPLQTEFSPEKVLTGLGRRFWRLMGDNSPGTPRGAMLLAMDRDFHNTMMVRLLVCAADDPGIAPYFKLVYDGRYARVFEVL